MQDNRGAPVAGIKERERLRDLLLQMRGENKSQRMLARQLGVSPTAIRDWENGRVYPHDGNLALIAQANGWSLEQIKYFLQTGASPERSAFSRLLDELEQLQPSQVVKALSVLVRRLETAGVSEGKD